MNKLFEKLKKINKLWYIPIGILLALGIYFLPPVHDRLSTRIDLIRSRIFYYFNPPSDAIFQPAQESPFTIETALATARAEIAQTLTPQTTLTPTPGPTLTPTITSTPVPGSVNLPGVTYVNQYERWNYCGPANLTMALNFWGWKGNRDDVAKVVKPGDGDLKKDFIQQGFADKNVMPYELVDFVNEETEYRALSRYGGDIDLVKRLIAAGFPVIVEKGYYEGDFTKKIDWLGHYLFTTGYDDAQGSFIVQDTWIKDKKGNPIGKNLLSKYEEYADGWRSFNYLFIVVYPANRDTEVMHLLGNWADESWANQHALEIAQQEIETLSGNNLFFAWFNQGTSLVALRDYVGAGAAYDKAFSIYATWDIKKANRPFRMLWYQTGPYFAYFYSQRYQDVINLANTTLNDTISTPTLEESLLWRGRAYYQIGNTQAAIDDYRATLKIHKGWLPAIQALQDLGLQP